MQTTAAESGTHSSTVGGSRGMKKRFGSGVAAGAVVALVSDKEDEALNKSTVEARKMRSWCEERSRFWGLLEWEFVTSSTAQC